MSCEHGLKTAECYVCSSPKYGEKKMNKEIIKMAQKAHLVMYDYEHPSLERFAALVAAAEREACVDVIKQTKFSNWFQADCIEAIRARSNT